MKVNYTEPFNFKPIPSITVASDYWQNGTWKFGSLEITPNTAYAPSAIEITLSGLGALTLINALPDSLLSLKLFGGTELLPETYIDSVTAEGKCEQRNLPEGYTQLEFLQSTGTQYIDTGIKADSDYSVDIVFTTPSTLSNGSLFGNQSSDILLYLISGKFDVYNNNTKVLSINTTINTNTTYSIKLTVSGTSATISGDLSATLNNLTISGTYNILIGANHNVLGNITDYGKFKYNSVTIQKGGAIAFGTYPAKDSSNNIGIYDVATSSLKQNAGTGSFTAGADVTTPSPDYPMDIVCNNGTLKVRNTSGLPLGYTKLTYIESNGTQAINTGVKYDGNDFVIKWRAFDKSTNSNTTLFACTGMPPYSGGLYGNNASRSYFIGTNSGQAVGYVSNDNIAHDWELTVSGQDVTLKKDGVQVGTGTFTGTINTTHNIYLFCGGRTSTTSQTLTQFADWGLVYWQLWKSGTLAFDGVACKDSNNTLGIYDKVSNTFKTNAGTGTFMAGAVDDSVEVYTDGTTETITDNVGNTATCTDLLSVGSYKDTQEVISGAITRNIGIKVLDGTEDWKQASTATIFNVQAWDIPLPFEPPRIAILSTHFVGTNATNLDMPNDSIKLTNSTLFSGNGTITIRSGTYDTIASWTQFLADQYANGTPVTIVYPLATATTESVASQTLTKAPVTYAGSISGLTGTTVTSSHTTPTPTQPLQINCNNGVVGINAQGNITVTGTTEKVEVRGKNLLSNTPYKTGYYIDANGVEQPASSNPQEYIIRQTIVQPSTEYTISCVFTNAGYTQRIHAYDKDGNWISQVATLSSAGSATFTTPNNCKYIRQGGRSQSNYQLELGSTATDYEAYYNGGSATAQDLYKVGTYQDVQEVLTGDVTRNVGIKVLDGTENWTRGTAIYASIPDLDAYFGVFTAMCTHFQAVSNSQQGSGLANTNKMCVGAPNALGAEQYKNTVYIYGTTTDFPNVTAWTNWLKDQYNSGNPVIVIYPKSTAATESVTPQSLTIQQGTNIVEITEASMDGLELEVMYKAGVTVTVEEIENAQLDNNVEVTIQ